MGAFVGEQSPRYGVAGAVTGQMRGEGGRVHAAEVGAVDFDGGVVGQKTRGRAVTGTGRDGDQQIFPIGDSGDFVGDTGRQRQPGGIAGRVEGGGGGVVGDQVRVHLGRVLSGQLDWWGEG